MKTVITQKGLSEILGVHQTTISGVLNDRPDVRVSPETRKRILDAVKKYGYKPSLHAQILRQGKSRLIGMLNFTPGMHGFEMQLRTVELLQESGFLPLVNDVFCPNRALESLQFFLDLKVSGIILKSMPAEFAPLFKKKLMERRIPAICQVGSYVPGIPWVHPNKRAVMEALTLYLIKNGYRRLALFSTQIFSVNPPDYSHTQELSRGFQQAIEKSSGLVESAEIIDPELSEPIVSVDAEQFYRAGKEVTRRLIAERKQLPEVLLYSEDHWALGAMAACLEAGIKVPEEIALTGYGNSPAGMFSPISLTTINPPNKELAKKAVEALTQMIASPEKPPEPIMSVDHSQVVPRQSTRVLV